MTVRHATAWSAFPLTGERVRLDLTHGTAGTLTRLADGVVAGRFSLSEDEGALVVGELVVEDPYRGYGLGTEAGRLLRDFADAGGWPLLRAWAHPDLGLSVYFWVRMGLQPRFGEGPNGGIWFERAVGVARLT